MPEHHRLHSVILLEQLAYGFHLSTRCVYHAVHTAEL